MACLTAVAITCLTLIVQAQRPPDIYQPFQDVPADHPNYDAIRQVAWKAWMLGWPDGTFRPDLPITNQQIVRVIDRIIDHDYQGSMTRGQLADLITDAIPEPVPEPAWYPNLNWGNPEPCEQGLCVRLPISRQDGSVSIRWRIIGITNWSEFESGGAGDEIVRFYNNDWTEMREPELVVPIGSVEDPNDDRIVVIVHYRQGGQEIQVVRHILTNHRLCPGDRWECYTPRLDICYNDDTDWSGYSYGFIIRGLYFRTCWVDIREIPSEGQKWQP